MATAELAQRGIIDYKLIVKVPSGVVNADNITDLSKFHADHEANDADTIADLKRQLKVRKQANAKLKRADGTLTATNKEVVSRLRDAQDERASTAASIVGEVAVENWALSSDQTTEDADRSASHEHQAHPCPLPSKIDGLETALQSAILGQPLQAEDKSSSDGDAGSEDDDAQISSQASIPDFLDET